MAKGKSNWAAQGRSGTMTLRIYATPNPHVIARQFTQFKAELMDLRNAWRALVPTLIDEERAIFAQRGAPLAGYWGGKATIPWQDLKRKYAMYRRFRKGTRKKTRAQKLMMGPVNVTATLSLTGKLLASLTSVRAARISKRYMRFGTRLPYAGPTQFGKFGGGFRPFLGKTQRIMDDATRRVSEETQRKIDRIFAGASRAELLLGSIG